MYSTLSTNKKIFLLFSCISAFKTLYTYNILKKYNKPQFKANVCYFNSHWASDFLCCDFSRTRVVLTRISGLEKGVEFGQIRGKIRRSKYPVFSLHRKLTWMRESKSPIIIRRCSSVFFEGISTHLNVYVVFLFDLDLFPSLSRQITNSVFFPCSNYQLLLNCSL